MNPAIGRALMHVPAIFASPGEKGHVGRGTREVIRTFARRAVELNEK